jgi:hypothetical protein
MLSLARLEQTGSNAAKELRRRIQFAEFESKDSRIRFSPNPK